MDTARGIFTAIGVLLLAYVLVYSGGYILLGFANFPTQDMDFFMTIVSFFAIIIGIQLARNVDVASKLVYKFSEKSMQVFGKYERVAVLVGLVLFFMGIFTTNLVVMGYGLFFLGSIIFSLKHGEWRKMLDPVEKFATGIVLVVVSAVLHLIGLANVTGKYVLIFLEEGVIELNIGLFLLASFILFAAGFTGLLYGLLQVLIHWKNARAALRKLEQQIFLEEG